MRKDIEIPKAKNVYVVAVKEWDEDFQSQEWNIYLINGRTDVISMVLVVSRGKSEDRKTSTLRQSLGDIQPNQSIKIEFIPSEVLGFTNEYLVTFFAENKLFEKNYVFDPKSISDSNLDGIPLLEKEGVFAR
ncbi:hypothetical protein EI546_11650 [Aequorivita sp. H23M31]|uniref:Phenylalanyl-tRNA synthetase subunit alpha n=1 Tax=Aequorivita ciconiae TaxID=2494375 RepID=A0A410G509_9FLAO|nr:hypothetical protein [Aequorivita sp. H23M31]QAA82330.1 hypothetical protein EI546_11650 [Aequorivita sp. H23M31]